ncbi:hypothetical protein RHMOL_Rhmol10G0218700 [Rhododendron molle]|uniref:Uncharacterized protein n=1 Tax=Rhododendron molle TaxID=49168 RepID=A0ACC0M4N3_RHOML|nr:hypothetical protein RHMOL_Rhmol10G0218700 [Rhododendron molle]
MKAAGQVMDKTSIFNTRSKLLRCQRLCGEIEYKLTGEIEKGLNEKFMSQWKHMEARMDLCESQAGVDASKQLLLEGCRQVFNGTDKSVWILLRHGLSPGEANFLGGVASVKGVEGFNPEATKKRFFEIYLDKYEEPNSGIGFPGALELIAQKGLKVAVASSADRIKVDANLAAAGLRLSMFDSIVSADAFENLKPAPDIFLAASKILNVPIGEHALPSELVARNLYKCKAHASIAYALRCIAVTMTLAEETLKTASPALIRPDIGSVSVDDFLCGGSSCHNEKMQGSHLPNYSGQHSAALLVDVTASRPFTGTNSANNEVFSIGGLQGSRRDIVRYGRSGIAISCLGFIITNWQAMQYASPKSVWNLLFGVSNSPSFGQNEGCDDIRAMDEIKKLDPATSKRVSTVASTGKAGFKDGMAQIAQTRTINVPGVGACTAVRQVVLAGNQDCMEEIMQLKIVEILLPVDAGEVIIAHIFIKVTEYEDRRCTDKGWANGWKSRDKMDDRRECLQSMGRSNDLCSDFIKAQQGFSPLQVAGADFLRVKLLAVDFLFLKLLATDFLLFQLIQLADGKCQT